MNTNQYEEAIKILVVDDHPLFRKGIVYMIEEYPDMRVVGEASNGNEALACAQELMPDLILMDVMMPECDGLQATRMIMQAMPYAKIVMLTVNDDDSSLFQAIKWGAYGYLLKNLEPEDLVEMIRGVFRGEAPISTILARRILDEFGRLAREKVQPTAVDGLTSREREVLKLVAQGKTNKEIAANLTVTEHTVKNHLRNILEKLHVRNRVEAAIMAIREGLMED